MVPSARTRLVHGIPASGVAEPESALGFVTREPLVNELVSYLEEMRRQIVARPSERHTFVFSRGGLRDVRAAFARTIRHGEERLHRVCELLGEAFLEAEYALQSVVIGEVTSTKERFTLVQSISPHELYSQTDLDLGTRQLRRLRYYDGRHWSGAALVANFVEYQPARMNKWLIHKLTSRIKAEEQIWNKVVDSIFGLDRLVRLDKQLRHLNRYVKDVFGVKMIVGDVDAVQSLHAALLAVRWDASTLARHRVPVGPSTTSLELVEVKDYLARRGRKASGWEAIKSVFRWWDTTIEIQIQPLRNFQQERERFTRESHAGFKARREAVRNQIAISIPLFGFYRDLLRWLFLSPPDQPAPTFESVEIRLTD
ncbi:MAG: hypothetical protein AB7F99_02055 [Vicinamibacterales bacterium]